MCLCLQQSKRGLEGRTAKRLLSLYLEGRSVATMKQYGGAYRKWIRFLKERESLTCVATEELVCCHLMRMEKKGEGEGAVNQFLAMIEFLSELQGHESCTKSQIVGQVRKAVVKRMNCKKKRKLRLSMKRRDMKKFLRALFRDDQYLQNKRLLVIVGLMFFLIKRFSDTREWRWELLESLENEDVRVLQPKSKTDQEGVGVEWHIPEGRQGVVGPAELIGWFWECVGRPQSGLMFGSYKSVRGELVVSGSVAIGYDTIRK